MEWWNNIDVFYRSGAIVVAGFFVHLLIKLFILRGLEKVAAATSNDLDDRLVYFIKKFYFIVLAFVIFILLLNNHGVEITPFLASAGIVGIAIGLAAKETLENILSGVFLIADRPIRVGDRIKIERPGKHWGGWGDVVEIGLRRTQIKNTDGVIVDYPNSILANSIITNFSYLDAPVRVRIRFQVDYDADIDQVFQITKDAINATPGVIPDTADTVIRGLWSDDGGHQLAGVLVEGRYTIPDVRTRTRIRSTVLRNLVARMRQNNIPFATQHLNINTPAQD